MPRRRVSRATPALIRVKMVVHHRLRNRPAYADLWELTASRLSLEVDWSEVEAPSSTVAVYRNVEYRDMSVHVEMKTRQCTSSVLDVSPVLDGR